MVFNTLYPNSMPTKDRLGPMDETSAAPDVVDPLALENQVCFALAVAARSVIALYRPLLEPMGLTHPQYLVMLALWGRSPLSVTELSGMLALDPGTLSPLLKRLEAAGVRRAAPRPRQRAHPRGHA